MKNEIQPSHLPYLDGLRGIAVLYVLLSHLSNKGINFLPFIEFSGIGKYGVYLFFILSSFLLDRQIALALIHQKATLKYWFNYFLRRFLRIYPLFIISLLLNFTIYSLGYKYCIPLNKNELINHILLLQGKFIYWSIPVEFKYYFISPFLMLIFSQVLKWNFKYIFIFIFIISLLSQYISHYYHYTNLSVIKYLPVFLIGTILALISTKSNKAPLIPNFIPTICMGILILLSPKIFNNIFQTQFNNHFFHELYIFIGLLWGIIIYACLYNKFLNKFLSIPLLRYTGLISFSIYLFHKPILEFVYYNFNSNIYRSLLFFVLTYSFCFFTYSFIEKPLSKIKIKY